MFFMHNFLFFYAEHKHCASWLIIQFTKQQMYKYICKIIYFLQFFWQQNGELWMTATPYQRWRNLPASTHQRLFNLKIWLRTAMNTCHHERTQIKTKKNMPMNSWWWILKKNLTSSYTCDTHGNGKKGERINWVFTGSYSASVRAHYYK